MIADVVVIGGGLTGLAVGYGLAGRNVRVLVLDGGDRDFRASTANFGLVWLQGKGLDMPAYQQLTGVSVEQWPSFEAELTATTGIDLQYENNGGLTLCVGEAEFEARRAKLLRLHNQLGAETHDWEMLERAELERLLPGVPLGAAVSGASFGPRDGHANPLRLLTALQQGIVRKGGTVLGAAAVHSIKSDGRGGFIVGFGDQEASTARVVIAAGLGSAALAAQVGLTVPLRPQRGQILVTERLEPFLPLPISGVRQTRDGTVMIGVTHEETGLDASTTSAASTSLSAAALRWLPGLGQATLVRQWAGLRVMTPDSYPVYAQSESHPGAFVALCHSGVTLAAFHADQASEAIAQGRLPTSFDVFHQRRFDVSKAA